MLWRPDMSRAGLLAPFVPSEGAVELLNKFPANKRNEVWLLSGLPDKSLEKFAGKAPGVGVVAENGCFAKIPAQNGKGGRGVDKYGRQFEFDVEGSLCGDFELCACFFGD